MDNMSLSLLVLVAVAGAAFIAAGLLVRLRSRSMVWVAMAGLWSAAIAGIVFVDVQAPLTESHLRPGGEPAPLWLTLAAAFARFAALASVFTVRHVLRQPVVEPNQPLQPIAREDARSD
jgi:hypothetical protein